MCISTWSKRLAQKPPRTILGTNDKKRGSKALIFSSLSSGLKIRPSPPIKNQDQNRAKHRDMAKLASGWAHEDLLL